MAAARLGVAHHRAAPGSGDSAHRHGGDIITDVWGRVGDSWKSCLNRTAKYSINCGGGGSQKKIKLIKLFSRACCCFSFFVVD